MKRTQRGFTLIELMIALLISSLLVILLLSIFARLSFAYRQQSDVVGVTQKLAGARQLIDLDAKQAGLEVSNGFKLAADGSPAGANLKHSPIVVKNSATAPDEVGFYYADKSKQALVTSTGVLDVAIEVDDASDFAAGTLVVLSTVETATTTNPIDPVNDAKLSTFDACVLQINNISGTSVTFETTGNWGSATNDHCAPTVSGKTMMYAFVARYWRLDPARPAEGVLQLAANGNLVANETWSDQAYDFTDLQVATYFYDDATDDSDTADPDSDGSRDWYSDDEQDTLTAPILTTASFTPALMMTISLVARTERDVEGVTTASTPLLIGATGGTDHNTIGDRDAVPLPSTDSRLTGNRIYRYLTWQADLRNLGVGR